MTPCPLPTDFAERIPVAVAVLANARGEVLISQRHPASHQGGLWEFPGGKIEPREGNYRALCRELKEEIDITVSSARPLIRIPHDYTDRGVSLDVWLVTRWWGTPKGREGQAIAWVAPKDLRAYSFPAADIPIITAIRLPDTYLITPEPDWDDVDSFLDTLDRCLSRGVRLVQLRIKQPPTGKAYRMGYRQLAARVLARCHARGARCLLNAEPSLAREMGMHGVHLTSRRLLGEDAIPARSSNDDFLIGASCHNKNELEHACRIGVDFAVLAPVKATKTHPEATPLTWERFAALTRSATIPVYALGGLSLGDRETAWERGAQGIAAIRALWDA
nr:MAG: 8-oxo-dGTP diphosphatase [Candidatus Kentron sp. FM]VFK07334.1 MAG: 8-oxo-dGTP diphosphatase [Candidatus Kentron sp. FM]